ncbi:ribosomal protein S18 [Polyplosphaeria fusca]|uniref:Small ribosomal subunit protein bS18m n=1 Tax=Polyplosphaeria fusca TaxID=682080 RepID=A0A9P4UZ57_9PLEO|nr:ribosomal protein S18 [Polyplosphaeria fusca]
MATPRRIAVAARHMSSSAPCRQQPNFDILNVLRSSTVAQSHPSNTTSQAIQPLTGTAFFRDTVTADRRSTMHQANMQARRDSFQKQIHRVWKTGDVYAPHDLSGMEQKKWKMGRKTPQSDAFDTLGINPINEYKNFTIMSEYMTEMGRIKHSKDTGLRPVNQRRIAKAIRRAVGLGLMPSVHRHPLVLQKTTPARFV